jgi:NAD(P)-dependent dehydrogenase (short-subunit alcohol dehydrogenase family)
MSEQSVPQQRVWLVTGCSSGFGLELVHAILARGDKVIATARNIDDLVRELKSEPRASTVKLDVTQPLAELKSIAETAISIFGRVDILVNNAGYVQRGAIEECT